MLHKQRHSPKKQRHDSARHASGHSAGRCGILSRDFGPRRSSYITNEAALDCNAGFTGALAALAGEHGGKPLDIFPPAEQQ